MNTYQPILAITIPLAVSFTDSPGTFVRRTLGQRYQLRVVLFKSLMIVTIANNDDNEDEDEDEDGCLR